jgi:hypothetical protein
MKVNGAGSNRNILVLVVLIDNVQVGVDTCGLAIVHITVDFFLNVDVALLAAVAVLDEHVVGRVHLYAVQ